MIWANSEGYISFFIESLDYEFYSELLNEISVF